jgi:ParB family chromosome partitioning protein
MSILLDISLNSIKTKNNYRKTFKDKSLRELAQSIKNQGVIEPIVVARNGTGYKLIAGERRVRAAEIAGLATIPAVIKDVADEDILEIQLIENIQRENVPYFEEAQALRRLRDERDYNLEEIAKKIGKSDWYVWHMVALTNTSEVAQDTFAKGEIGKTVAFQIARLAKREHQSKAAEDLRREDKTKLISDRVARQYLKDQFGDGATKQPRRNKIQKINGNDYQANWKKYLVNFSCEEFEHFKKIVRGRTDTTTLAEAVDMVMRKSE